MNLKRMEAKEKILVIIAIILVATIVPLGTIYAIKSNNSHKESRKDIRLLGDRAVGYMQEIFPDEEFKPQKYYDIKISSNNDSDTESFEEATVELISKRRVKCKVKFQKNEAGVLEIIEYEILNPWKLE